jgi:transcriptional regulator with XRE-family HTH domain
MDNMKQGEFARKIGLPQSTWAAIELGNNPLSDKYIKLICLTFNVNETWLRTGNGEIFVNDLPYKDEMLEIFSNLLPENQDYIISCVKQLYETQEKLKNKYIREEPPSS